jgi:nucleotidyltransferase/DNA polymerase involved in DNA repair
MSLSEAKQLLPDGQFVAFRRELFESEQERVLSICLEASSTIEPDDVHSAWLDLSGHPTPTFVAERLLRSLMEAGYEPYAALANAKWVARLFAYRFTSTHHRLALEDGERFCAISTKLLDPVHADDREHLILLGYSHIGDVRQLSLARLQSLFGKDRGLSIYEAARAKGSTVVRPVYPSHSVSAQIYFDPPVSDRMRIRIAQSQIALELQQRLLQRHLSGSALVGFWEDESARCLRFSRRSSRDLNDHRSLFTIMSQLTDAAVPDAPLVSVRWMMPSLRQHESRQLSLFSTDRHHSRSAPLEALRKLQAVFGQDSIKLASEAEQSRRLRLLRAWHYPMRSIFPNRGNR